MMARFARVSSRVIMVFMVPSYVNVVVRKREERVESWRRPGKAPQKLNGFSVNSNGGGGGPVQ